MGCVCIMRVVSLALMALLSVVVPSLAHAQGAVVQSGQAAPGHVAIWAGNGAILDGGAGQGNFITTWPSSGAVVISNGTSNPPGILPSTNGCLASSGGVWGIGTCGGGGGGGSGTVTSVAITPGNGFSGSVANATTTPTITLSTTSSGVLKGSSGGIVAAVAGTDYVTPTGSGAGLTGILYSQLPSLSANQLLGSLTATTPGGLPVPSCSAGASALTWTLGVGFGCNTISSGGTVTSVIAGSGLSGGTITTTGTIAFATQSANTILGSLTAVAPSGLAVPTCSGANNALNWTSGTGFGCVTISGGGGSAGVAVVQDFLAGTNFTPGSTTTLTLGSTPTAQAAVEIDFDGIKQSSNTWTLASTVITFAAAIPLNVQVVEAQWVQSSGTSGSGVTSVTAGSGLSGGTITSAGTIALAAVTANTVLGAVSSTTPGPLTMPSCSSSSSALTWTTGGGFGCNTISGGGGGALTIGTTTVANGVNGSLLYNNNGVLGNETLASILIAPPPIGGTTPASGSFTVLSASSLGGAAFSNFLASTGTGLLTQPVGGGWYWDSGMTVYNTTESTEPWEYTSGTISTITYFTGGTTPTFTIGFFINGTPITGCTGITVTSATPASTTCTAANTIARGQYLTMVTSATGGTPQSSLVAYAGTRSNF